MDKKLNKDINRYLREIKALLICDRLTKHRFVRDFKNDLFEYADNHPDVGIDALREHFGEPMDIARSFLENVNIKAIKKRMNVSRIIAAGAFAALIIWAVGVTAAVVDAHFSEDYFVESSFYSDDNEEIVADTSE